MERTERFYRICHLLRTKKVVSKQLFMDDMEVSRATISRDLQYLTDRMNAPIVWDRALNGYRFELDDAEHPFELPGLWFNASEIHALLTMEHILEKLQPGLLAPHLGPLKENIKSLMEKGDHTADEIQTRIKVLPLANRPYELKSFETICGGLLLRKRLFVEHYSRVNDKVTERELSPQHLVYYRDNWYLDAWCHLRKGLRTFSVDTIRKVHITKKKARSVGLGVLNRHLASGYGIFSGNVKGIAKLRFNPERARWVSKEIWHANQVSKFDSDGNYLLELPFSDERELIMDILKFGSDVEVLAPDSLRAQVAQKLKDNLRLYS